MSGQTPRQLAAEVLAMDGKRGPSRSVLIDALTIAERALGEFEERAAEDERRYASVLDHLKEIGAQIGRLSVERNDMARRIDGMIPLVEWCGEAAYTLAVISKGGTGLWEHNPRLRKARGIALHALRGFSVTKDKV